MSEQYLNIIIDNENYIPSDDILFFADNDFAIREKVIHTNRDTTIYDLLVRLGVFQSKSDARKNWKRGEIKPGYQEIKKIGKGRKELYILNPCGSMNE